VVRQVDKEREAYLVVEEESARLALEDGIEELPVLNAGLVWDAANRGRPRLDEDEQHPWGVGLGHAVEVRDTMGKWHPAIVVRMFGKDIRVRRADGQMRLVRDRSKIRTREDQRIGHSLGLAPDRLDFSEKTLYIRGMADEIGFRTPSMTEDIVTKRFNVTIPAGSNSWKIETALMPITDEMNRTPLNVSADTWLRNFKRVESEVQVLTQIVREMSGVDTFRPNATADCVKALFVEEGLPVQRVSDKTGQPTCDKEVLQALHAMGSELAGAIIKAREAMSKLSQLTKWEEFAQAGSVQCRWNQFGTPHGRYSCDKPNLQNRISEIRESIVARPGFRFISLDLGQAEYVTWASLSGDPTLTQAFESGRDFHEEMGKLIRAAAPDIDLHEPSDRAAGKTLNFALLYLMLAFTLSKKLGISGQDAQTLITTYKKRAPLAEAYRQDLLNEATRTGEVQTKFGRLRSLPEVKSAKGGRKHELQKTMWHHHNAGTAAEILKIKQVKVLRAIRRQWEHEDARIVLQMHDEIILEAREEIADEVAQLANEKFLEPIAGFLPFKVEVRQGANWLEISK